MKSVGAAATKKAEAKADGAEASAEEAKPVENVDFSNVKIEPIFKEMVDFDTFAKSDFRAVKILACEAVKKSKKLLKFTLDDDVMIGLLTGCVRSRHCISRHCIACCSHGLSHRKRSESLLWLNHQTLCASCFFSFHSIFYSSPC